MKFKVDDMSYVNSGDKQDSYYTTYIAVREGGKFILRQDFPEKLDVKNVLYFHREGTK